MSRTLAGLPIQEHDADRLADALRHEDPQVRSRARWAVIRLGDLVIERLPELLPGVKYRGLREDLLEEMALSRLGQAWRGWWRVLGEFDSHKSDEAARARVIQALGRYLSWENPSPERIEGVLGALSKGKALIDAAMQWRDPAAGVGPGEPPTATDKVRGAQWRLVMAYGGFETLIKTVLGLGAKDRPPDRGHFEQLVARSPLSAHPALAAPPRGIKSVDRWFEDAGNGGANGETIAANVESDQESHPLIEFLTMTNGDVKIFRRWFLQGEPVTNWVDALFLARAIRNATAHGALSASKAAELKLGDAIAVLTRDLSIVAAAIFETLAAGQPD